MLSRFRKLASSISKNARRRRADLFRSSFHIDESTTILDLGSQDGAHVNLVFEGTSVDPKNVCIADLKLDAMAAAQNRFGYRFAVIEEAGTLPFEDDSFDIVFCSSVIEHVTVPKEDVWKISDGSEFLNRSWISQTHFADEIRRVGRGYFT
jgi:SAM-dependent methyltransferase